MLERTYMDANNKTSDLAILMSSRAVCSLAASVNDKEKVSREKRLTDAVCTIGGSCQVADNDFVQCIPCSALDAF